jgi:exodeoxyribonuclease V alpha subunit
VGAGNVLKDIISSGKIPFVKLERIFRQAQDSEIITNAHKINKGLFPELKSGRDMTFSLFKKRIQKKLLKQ